MLPWHLAFRRDHIIVMHARFMFPNAVFSHFPSQVQEIKISRAGKKMEI